MSQSTPERYWTRRASLLARRVNLGWCLERLNGMVVIAASLAALTIFAMRIARGNNLPLLPTGLGLAALSFFLIVLAAFRGRRRFIGTEQALVRLDEHLSLNSRLISAWKAVGDWPAIPSHREAAGELRWVPLRVWTPLVISVALVAAAWYLPVSPQGMTLKLPPVEPGLWEEMEDWIATLQNEELIDDSAIKELEGKIEELREQPGKEWFSHSSLEATDTLADTLGREIRELESGLTTLDRSISALDHFSSEMSAASREMKMQEFNEALEALKGSGLGVDEDLLKKLQQIDPAQLGQETLANLSAEQLKSLQKSLQKGAQALGSLEGLPSVSDDPSLDSFAAGESGQLGEGLGEGQGEAPGAGGVSRGRGDAPLSYGEKTSDLGTSTMEKISNTDFSRATPGEVLGLGETERKLDQSPVAPRAGGTLGSAGSGGEAVSREVLRPDEEAVLKRYFK
ncbi:MAG: hypothetical protein KA250_04970 [Verrucomicrobiales bacterium]|jgi:hypothetical protein|nr:hypothetical protein [Verrucomicrobiales bacterium]MBP9225600.1 hypothetical protein [Verrucomicrobiales bacterium]